MNRAEQKYAGLHDLSAMGAVEVVAVEQNTIRVMSWIRKPRVKPYRGHRPFKRWYLVVACCGPRGVTWYGKLACPATVARVVQKHLRRSS
jgi:hypothetical protein